MKINFRRLAAAELRRDAAWYNLRKTGLGRDFRRAIQAVLDGIVDYPERWPLCQGHIRRAVVPRFPYVIYYESKDDSILVYRVVHSSIDPGPIRDLLP